MIEIIIILVLLILFGYTQYRQKKFDKSVERKAKSLTDKLKDKNNH
ncbi:MAG TPA: hypothetical protein K8V21_03370 [Weissella thailandensis]|nr:MULTISPECIES: hypothetical protein [Weissella]HJG84420.1 hypothetical protein [Weissella thailandensis]